MQQGVHWNGESLITKPINPEQIIGCEGKVLYEGRICLYLKWKETTYTGNEGDWVALESLGSLALAYDQAFSPCGNQSTYSDEESLVSSHAQKTRKVVIKKGRGRPPAYKKILEDALNLGKPVVIQSGSGITRMIRDLPSQYQHPIKCEHQKFKSMYMVDSSAGYIEREGSNYTIRGVANHLVVDGKVYLSCFCSKANDTQQLENFVLTLSETVATGCLAVDEYIECNFN